MLLHGGTCPRLVHPYCTFEVGHACIDALGQEGRLNCPIARGLRQVTLEVHTLACCDILTFSLIVSLLSFSLYTLVAAGYEKTVCWWVWVPSEK